MSSYFRQQLENWLKTLDIKGGRVLDIGGGALPVKFRTKNFDVDEYLIMDNELEVCKEHADYRCDLNHGVGYSYDPAEIFNRFDIVFCLEVFEYIWNPVEAMKNIYNLLKEGGTAYLSFPFIYPHHNPKGHDYLRYTRWGVDKLLKEVGFKEWEIIPRKCTTEGYVNLRDFVSNESMHPCKNFGGHDEIGYIVIAKK